MTQTIRLFDHLVINLRIRLLFLAIIITFSSCSSPNKIIKNYLINEININKGEPQILVKEKTSLKVTIHKYVQNRMHRFNEYPYLNDNERAYFYNKTETDSINNFWINNDFKKENILLLSEKNNQKEIEDFLKKEKKFSANICRISEPFYSKDKNLFMFWFSKDTTLWNDGGIKKVIIYRKINGKWVNIEKLIK